MFLAWLQQAAWGRALEKAAELAAHGSVTAWQLRRLEHTCSPSLKCEAASINVSCPEARLPEGADCSYHTMVIQLLWLAVTALSLLCVVLGACVVLVCARGLREPLPVTLPAPGKTWAIALKERYGIAAAQPR